MNKRSHHQLKAWQKAIELVSHIYAITKQFPRQEIYALTDQMRRSAVSVPSNIAEGAARTTTGEFLNFLSMARGSLSELETQVIISQRLGYMEENHDIEEKIDEVFRLLAGLVKAIKKK
ncbi:MAG: four helix bundle protein [Gammaproteobacteria bacterium]